MRNEQRGAAVILALAIAAGAEAQTSRADPVDLQAWFGTSLKLDLPNKWESTLEYRARLINEAAEYKGSYFTLEGAKGVGSGIALITHYRLAKVEGGTYHRIGLGAQAAREFGDTELSFRPQLQYQKQHFIDDDETSSDADTYLRTRVLVKQKLSKRIDLYGSVEPYFKFGAEYPIDNWRNTIGTKLEYSKGKRVDLFYIYRPDYAKSYNRTFHIVGVNLDFAWKPDL